MVDSVWDICSIDLHGVQSTASVFETLPNMFMVPIGLLKRRLFYKAHLKPCHIMCLRVVLRLAYATTGFL